MMVSAAEQFNHRHSVPGSDPVTGLDTNTHMRDAIFQSIKDKNGWMVELDFLNIGNLNQALGRRFSNAFMQFSMSVLMRKIETHSPNTLYGYRKPGSDEASLLISGISENDLKAALEKTEDTIRTYCQSNGLDSLTHRKPRRPAGIGMVAAFGQCDAATSFQVMRDELGQEISGKKRQLALDKPRTGVPVGQFHSHTGEGIKDEGLPSTPFAMHVPLGMKDQLVVHNTHEVSDRQEMLADLKERDRGTFMRLDISQFDAMNAFGHEYADRVMEDFQGRIIEKLNAELSGAVRIYKTGGNTLDLIVDATISTNILEAIKPELVEIWNDVLEDHGHADLQSTSGLHIMNHTIQGIDSYPLLERIDRVKEVFKLQGISHIQQEGEQATVRYINPARSAQNISHVHQNNTGNHIHDLAIAAQVLDPQTLTSMLSKPVGLIAGALLGIDLTPVLTAQHQISAMIEDGRDLAQIEGAIRQSQEGFHDYMRDMPHYLPASLLDTPKPANEKIPPVARTMNLAKQWGYISDGQHNIILTAQAGSRLRSTLNAKFLVDSNAAAIALEKDIPAWIKTAETVDIKRAQSAEHLFKMFKNVEIYSGQQFITPDHIKGFTALATHALNQAAQDSRKNGMPSLGESLQTMAGRTGHDIDIAYQAVIDCGLMAMNVLEKINPALAHNVESVLQDFISTFESGPSLEAKTMPPQGLKGP